MKIGLFGGSFNPIHVGHIALAKAALNECGLDEVWLMVSPQNPLKQDQKLLDDQLRLEMAAKALEGVEGVKACGYEFQLPKPSYTWHTLQALTKDYPGIIGRTFCVPVTLRCIREKDISVLLMLHSSTCRAQKSDRR